MKFGTLFFLLIFSKMLLCQNFLNYNSTPYVGADKTFFCDSLSNKYTFSHIIGNYSSSKFSFNVPSSTNQGLAYLLIKYDSLNNIVFYKTIVTDSGQIGAAYYNGNIYITLSPKTQYSYNNISYTTSKNLVILKVNAISGNLISTYSSNYPFLNTYFSNNNSRHNLFILNGRLYLILCARSNTSYLTSSIDSGLFCAVYDLNGVFQYAKNLPKQVASVTGMLGISNSIYITGKFDSVVVSYIMTIGFMFKFDTDLNLRDRIYYAYETLSPKQLNQNIIFSAYPLFTSTPFKNKLILSIVDTNLNIIKETSWGLGNGDLYPSYGYGDFRENSFSHLNVVDGKVIFCFVSSRSQDSLIGCNIRGKTSTNVFINTLDSNLNCLFNIQISNGFPYAFNPLFNARYGMFNEELGFTSGKQITARINYPRSTNATDTPFQFFLNNHKYPLGKMGRGNSDNLVFQQASPSPNIVSFYADKWLETFYPNKTNYCIGDTLKLAYKKWGDWHSGTQFKLEASTNPDFPNNSIRNIGSFTDTVNANDSIFYTNLKIPNMGGGLFYLRIRSLGPDRTSNLADTTIYIYNLPAANAGADILLCNGDTAFLNGNNYNNSFYWTSSIQNAISDSLSINTKLFTTDSAYAVLHTRNSPGCENTDTVYIHVIPKINLKYTIDSLYPKCVNANLKISISTSYNDSIIVNFGDGLDTVLKGNNQILFHHYTSLGTKNISIKAIANKCFDSTGFTLITRAPFQFAASNDTTLCKGALLSLWALASGGDSLFTYILKDSTTTLINASGLFLVSPPLTTVYRIGSISACALDTLWSSITVTVRKPINITLNTTDTVVCNGAPFVIKASAVGGTGVFTYLLKKNGITLQSNTSGSFVVNVIADETYTVLATDFCTPVNDSSTVHLKPFPILQFTQPLPDLYFCASDTKVLHALTSAGAPARTYQWMDASGTLLSSVDSLVFTPSTSFVLVLKISDACTTIIDTASVLVMPEPNDTLLSSDVLSGCAPLTVNFESANMVYSNNQEYEAFWDFGDGNTLVQNFNSSSISLKAKHTYINPGIYPVRVQVKFKNASSYCISFVTSIEALSVPQIALQITPAKITLPKTECTATITSTQADSIVIEWDDGFSDNFNTSLTSFTQTHQYFDTGHYVVKAIAYHKNSCYTETRAKVFHADTFLCYIPNIFTPNRDNLNEVFKPVVSYCKKYELTIYNRWGELVFENTYIAGQSIITGWDGGNYPSETYLYQIIARDGDNNRHTFSGTVMLVR